MKLTMHNKEWYHFKAGQMSVESGKCYGRLSTSRNPKTVKKVWWLMIEDSQIMIRETVREVEILFGLVKSVFLSEFDYHPII